ncbi:hypothetical protein YC2023_101918 [Brassica napus]
MISSEKRNELFENLHVIQSSPYSVVFSSDFSQPFVYVSADKSSSLYDLHLTSVQSSSSASHKRKKIYLAKRSSRAFNELRLATRNFRSNSVILEGDFSSALEVRSMRLL